MPLPAHRGRKSADEIGRVAIEAIKRAHEFDVVRDIVADAVDGGDIFIDGAYICYAQSVTAYEGPKGRTTGLACKELVHKTPLSKFLTWSTQGEKLLKDIVSSDHHREGVKHNLEQIEALRAACDAAEKLLRKRLKP